MFDRLHERLIFASSLLTLALACEVVSAAEPIDRHALVTRHNPVLDAVNFDSPFTVGNGGFAFTVGITGLQDFGGQYYASGIPLETLSRWAWASRPNPDGYQLSDANVDFVQANGRTVAYPTNMSGPAGQWLRQNPHSQPLGVISLDFVKDDGSPLAPEDIENPKQTLNLWTGTISSSYLIDDVPVAVTTVCHPDSDTISVRIESALVGEGRLGAKIAFPRGHDMSVKNTPALDWSDPQGHESQLEHGRVIKRSVDDLHYAVTCSTGFKASVDPHVFRVSNGAASDVLEFSIRFTEDANAESISIVDVPGTLEASAAHWRQFWSDGAAVDFSGSSDPRAAEIEKRIILSRYLTAVQLAGGVPPQESGLTCNTWYGKHHTEMIWWHTAHFALWGNANLLEKNLDWFRGRLPEARALAASRGLRGARWAKMVGPFDRESPGGNPLIVWNQPHMVYLCELLYRDNPSTEVLEKYRDLVLETAGCLASMIHYDAGREVYVLGPPLWIAQEIYDPATSQNPSFELAYWRWTLGVAQIWRERLGLPRDPDWDRIIDNLALLPEKDGKYVALGSHPDTWDNIESRRDHPEMLMPLGFLPGEGVDRETMARTLDAVLAKWDWETKIWGWDYPMIAMTAARLGRPETAVEILMRDGPNNHYLPNGHCPQRSDTALNRAAVTPGKPRREIAVYLPANGAFLSAVALMLAGWDGNERPFPGFPDDGTWVIRAEGLSPLP